MFDFFLLTYFGESKLHSEIGVPFLLGVFYFHCWVSDPVLYTQRQKVEREERDTEGCIVYRHRRGLGPGDF